MIGNICLGNVRRSSTAFSFKTHVLLNSYSTRFEQCPYNYHVKKRLSIKACIDFVFGKAKQTLKPALGELCAAVLAVKIVELIKCEIDLFHCYTMRKIVLGYIHNQTKQCYMYVSNRAECM